MTKTTSTQRTTITTPEINQDASVKSIRQIMIQGILAGTPSATIKAEVELHYPTSAGALKFSKHLAWYKAWIKAWIKKNPAKVETSAS